MIEAEYLDSKDPRVRRWTAVVFCVATAAATVAWAVWDGIEAVTDGHWLTAVWTVVVSVSVWWVVAGIGLRIVRSLARQRGPVGQLVD